jgi:formylglycine-generating enzyme required for sulfatase activity
MLRAALVLVITTVLVGNSNAGSVLLDSPTARPYDAVLSAVQREDYRAVFEVLQPLANQGRPEAQFVLGSLYTMGKGIPRDPVQAGMWFKAAAEQGYAAAQEVLAVMYLTGNGVGREPALAAQWSYRAAEQGITAAQLRLAKMQALGEGAPKDNVAAYSWATIAMNNAQEQQIRNDAIALRQILRRSTTSQQVEDAETAARAWKPKSERLAGMPIGELGPCSNGAMSVSLSSRGTTPLSASEECSLKPKDVFKECDQCPEMVVVPAGSFTMGARKGEKKFHDDDKEGPQHVVTINKPFAVGKLHVTVDQFSAFVRETGYEASSNCYNEVIGGRYITGGSGSWRNHGFAQEGSHPVVCMSWDDTKAYVAWIAKKTGKPYRLLSEAEWEYAARGRTSPGVYPSFWFGNNEKDLCRYGNGLDRKALDRINSFAKNFTTAPCNDGYPYTSPAGYYEPNAFGLYDMAGNASQWTEDCYHPSYEGAPADGSAWTTGCDLSGRVVRGGSWSDAPESLRAATRTVQLGSGYGGIQTTGFRLARTLTP